MVHSLAKINGCLKTGLYSITLHEVAKRTHYYEKKQLMKPNDTKESVDRITIKLKSPKMIVYTVTYIFQANIF